MNRILLAILLLFAWPALAAYQPVPGTNGQFVYNNNGQWAAQNISAVAVTTFSAGTTGFTPNSATSGAVTLSGTLGIANGGTGQITNAAAFTALAPLALNGDILYFNGTQWVVLVPGTIGSVLTTGGVSGNPSWAIANVTLNNSLNMAQVISFNGGL